MSDDQESRLLALPPEIREDIYREILHPAANRVPGVEDDDYDYNYRDALVLFKINRQIYWESRKIFRDLNVFIRIETPWAEAADHVAFEGHIPILTKGSRAKQFTGHSLNASIEGPHATDDGGNESFIILLEDLEKFTKTWLMADLSNPGLNSHLGLRLSLRDPHAPDWEEKRMPKARQRALLLPFGAVKDLGQLTVAGGGGDGGPRVLPSVEQELRAAMAVPPASPEDCLSECARLKDEGNKALTGAGGGPEAALELYRRAWAAMHIDVRGRRRHIHAEAYFARELGGDGPWRGRDGQTERLRLRVQLVANTCLAHARLGRWGEVKFWGLRTIHAVRANALGRLDAPARAEDEAVTELPAAAAMGKIYYRTGVAVRELGEGDDEARRLFAVAVVYLPQDESVRKAIEALGPPPQNS